MGMDSVFRVSLVLDMVDNMTSKVQGAADGVPSAVQKMNDAFGTMQKAGVAMTGMGTAIVGACMGTVTATFDTQDALAEVASLGVEDLGALEKAAKNFSDTWAGTTKSDFISASYDIKSGIASLTDEGVAQYTELAGLTAKATKATTADMTSLFATGYGIYKNYYSDLSDMEFGEMFSAGIATAVKNYKTSGTEMAGAIKMLGASATNANVPMEEQLAILGQLQATMSGTEAGTKYKSFLNTAASAGEKLGLNFLDANNQLLSMPDILEQLHGKYGDTIDAVEKKQLKDAFGTDEAIALIDLLYNNTDQLKTGIDDLQTSMDGGIDTTKKMAETINSTPAERFQVLKQQIHNVTEKLGKGLLPAVNTGLEAMIGLVQKGSDWVANNQETVATIMKIVAILGVFLIVAGVVTATVGTLGKAMTSLKTVTTLASKASGLFNSALLSSPITWVIGLIVALIAIFKACGGDVEQLGATFSNIFGKVGGFVGTAATAIAQKLPEFLQFGINLVLQIVSGIASGLPSLITSGIQIILMILSGLISAIPTLIGMIPELFSGVVDAVTSIDWLDVGSNLVNSIKDGFVSGFSSLVDTAKGLWDDFTGWLFGEDDVPDTTPVAGTATAIENDIPKVETAVDNANQALSTLDFNPDSLQQKGTESMQALADGITAGTPAAQAEAQNAGQSILDNFNLDTTGAGSAGANLMQSVTDGINTGTPEAQATAQNAGQEIMSSFNIDTSGAGSAGANLMQSVTDGINTGTPEAQATAQNAGQEIMSAFNIDTSGAGTAGTSLIESVTSGITANAGNAQAAAQSAGQEIMSAFNIDTSGAGSTGANLMQSVTDGIASGTAGAEAAAQSAGQEIMSAFNIDTSGAGSTGANLMQSVTDGITSGTAGAEAAAQSAGQEIMSAFNIDTSGAGSAGANLMQSLTGGITANAGSAQSAAQSAGQSALDAVDNLNATTVGTNMIKDIGSGITSGSGTTTSAAQKAGADAMNAFRNAVSSASELGRQMMSNVASGISSAGSSAVSTASGIAYQIKAAFENIHITVPRPSLPHVNVSYSTVGNGKATASVPNFSVSYYAKGAIMKKPTMFGMNGTSPMIGGEAGEEAIVPLDSLWNRMRNVVMNTFTMFFPGGKKQSDPTKEKNTVTQTKEKTEKQQTTTTKPEPKQAQPQGGTKYQTYHVTMNIDAQSIDDLRKLKKLLSELDGDNDPVTA